MSITFNELLFLGFFLLIWYLYNGLEYFLNSGNLGRHRYFFPFQCALEDFKLYSPFGREKRKKFIKDRLPLRGFDSIITTKKLWTVKDVTDSNGNYDDRKLLRCFHDSMGFGMNFIIKNTILLGVPTFVILFN